MCLRGLSGDHAVHTLPRRRRRNKHGQEYSQEDEVQTSSHDRLPSQYGFSRTMRIPEIEGKLDLQAEYTYQEGSAERETGTHVRGNLNLHMSLVAGEEIENASQEELIENTRSLFRRIFTSRHLTARQIWRFVGQCEEWEDDLKRHSPLTFASILENVLRDAGLRYICMSGRMIYLALMAFFKSLYNW